MLQPAERKEEFKGSYVNVWQQRIIWKESYYAIVGEHSAEFVLGGRARIVTGLEIFIYGSAEMGPLSYSFTIAVPEQMKV